EHGAKRSHFLSSGRRQRHLDLAGETVGGGKIIVQCDHGMPEAAAKMVNYTNHAKRYAADPEARENVENVLAQRDRRQRATHHEENGVSRRIWGAPIRRSAFGRTRGRKNYPGRAVTGFGSLTFLRMFREKGTWRLMA